MKNNRKEIPNLIKKQIEQLANKFSLIYNSKWFAMYWVSNRIETLTEYLGDCPDPIYNKYGKTREKRIKNIDKFVYSNNFKKCLNRFGGQIFSKKEWKNELKWINKIKNDKIQAELLKFHYNLHNQFKKTDYVALLTIPRNKKEEEFQLKWCLRHEWIHLLLNKNKIHFQEISKKYLPYDEGINCYMGAFLDNETDKLEEFKEKENYPLEKNGWIYAIRFRELLKDADSPILRKKRLVALISRLKGGIHPKR